MSPEVGLLEVWFLRLQSFLKTKAAKIALDF